MHQVSSLFNHCYCTRTLYENTLTRVLYFMARRRSSFWIAASPHCSGQCNTPLHTVAEQLAEASM